MGIYDDKPRVLLVVPAHNEEGSILSVAHQIMESGYDYIVINDGSTDGTLRICQTYGLNYIDLPINLGIGGAVQTGHRYALEHGSDVDIQVDGDGQHDISYVPRLLEEIDRGADLVIGSRFMGEAEGFQSTFLRRTGIKWLEGCIKFVTGLTITDCTSGFRASGRRAMSLFALNYPCDYPEPESIVTAHTHDLVVREVPVVMRDRQSGTSSINALRSIYYMVKVTLAVLIEGMGQRGGKK